MEQIAETSVNLAELNSQIDEIEAEMAKYPQVVCPLKHTFTKGMYAREICMPAGTWIISETHLTQHQYVISKGAVSVWIDEVEYLLQAPYSGVTEPNTRRVLYTHDEVIWTCFHPTEIKPENDDDEAVAEAVNKIGKMILKDNPLKNIKNKEDICALG
ncbi:MAG: hypothetical protein JWQ09_5873 [Segetibacter sp.]|nr:hypothetical protein [Segetibacter sp.]